MTLNFGPIVENRKALMTIYLSRKRVIYSFSFDLGITHHHYEAWRAGIQWGAGGRSGYTEERAGGVRHADGVPLGPTAYPTCLGSDHVTIRLAANQQPSCSRCAKRVFGTLSPGAACARCTQDRSQH